VADRPVLDAQQARQGKTGLQVRWVLGVGIALVILAFILVAVFSR
jgi:hypothetical protein